MMKSKRGRMRFAASSAAQTAFVINQPSPTLFREPSVLFSLLPKKALPITLIVIPIISPYLFYSLKWHYQPSWDTNLPHPKKLERETRLELATLSLEG